jgi:predicted ATPase
MSTFSDTQNTQGQNYNWHERRSSLRRWRIASFKSVKNPAEIELAPLTVVVGANSAGKSSLIQSILLVAQNASGVLSSNASQGKGIFELNSFLVQLGTLGEVICDLEQETKKESSFSLGGLWFLGKDNEFSFTRANKGLHGAITTEEESINLETNDFYLDWGARFKSTKKNYKAGLAPVDSSYALTLQNGFPQEIIEAKQAKESKQYDILASKYDGFSFLHNSTTKLHKDFQPPSGKWEDDFEETSFLIKEHFDPVKERNSAVHFRSGLPVSGLRKIGIIDYIFSHQKILLDEAYIRFIESIYSESADKNTRQVSEPNKSSNIELDDQSVWETENINVLSGGTLADYVNNFVDAVASIAQRILQQDMVGDDLAIAALAQSVEKKILPIFTEIPFDGLRAIEGDHTESLTFLDSARKQLDKTFENSNWIHEEILCSIDGRRIIHPRLGFSKTATLANHWNQYLSESVVYLGPLRASPKSTYGLGAGIENANIPLGESGEFTAKRLFGDKNLKRYRVPDNGKFIDMRITLEQAVSLWYQELCITPEESDQIEVQAPGRQGYLLNIGSRTLANVGFGVSQILPVIALCLISPPGSLILLEQPELHLNPGMQQKLADFLLEMVKTGRQIIVETHSEYLITRLRRRAATNENDHKYFGIVFAERDLVEGTSYRSVNVDEQGDLSEWPKGFFDHVAEDLRILMRKAAERQAKQYSDSVNTETAKKE